MARFICRSLILCLVVSVLRSPVLAQDGLYADFETSMGNFTCRLAFDKAPRTVANFVALAAGERAWLDLKTGSASPRPFYDGLTFHRVVAGFVIQGGSPKGDGTDGPGYTFQDEFDPTLRHSKAGILSMANSGPHSNGSQFFVTLAAATHLDDVHSVFGEVSSGMEVVNAIGNVATTSGGQPLIPVVMNRVTIRRVGAAANAFDTSAQGLPSVGGANPVMLRNGSNYSLRFPRAMFSEYLLYESSDLVTWINEKIGLFVSPPPSSDVDVSARAAGQSVRFYRVPQIAYPGPLLTPPALIGKQMHLVLSPTETLDLVFTTASGGTTTYRNGTATNSGTITTYSWTQEAYRGRLFVQSSNLFPISTSNVFANETGGNFKGTVFNNATGSPISGTFTFATAPGAFAGAPSLGSTTRRSKTSPATRTRLSTRRSSRQ